MTGIAQNCISDDLYEIIGRGLNYENAIKEACEAAYIKGKNEKIDIIKSSESFTPNKEASPILNSPKRSIWDY